jgi:hypothetical protein
MRCLVVLLSLCTIVSHAAVLTDDAVIEREFIARGPEAEARRPMEPVDEGKDDPEFAAFRKRLVRALKERDFDYLMSIITPEHFKCSFGGCESPEQFVEEWGLPDKDSPLWALFLDRLSLGGRFHEREILVKDDDGFTIRVHRRFFDFPYYAANGGLDFGDLVVIDDNVPLFAAPDNQSEVVARMSREIVEVADWTPLSVPTYDLNSPHVQAESAKAQCPWLKVTRAGQEGYVERRHVREGLGYRGSFELVDGQWRLRYFLAGD